MLWIVFAHGSGSLDCAAGPAPATALPRGGSATMQAFILMNKFFILNNFQYIEIF
ncbi:hypothetical protein PATSB16_32620 [Pandoraea thiooxydans]|nr:hypothetical protein PATSB16_32620 [Pandoraea thiooxydans]